MLTIKRKEKGMIIKKAKEIIKKEGEGFLKCFEESLLHKIDRYDTYGNINICVHSDEDSDTIEYKEEDYVKSNIEIEYKGNKYLLCIPLEDFEMYYNKLDIQYDGDLEMSDSINIISLKKRGKDYILYYIYDDNAVLYRTLYKEVDREIYKRLKDNMIYKSALMHYDKWEISCNYFIELADSSGDIHGNAIESEYIYYDGKHKKELKKAINKNINNDVFRVYVGDGGILKVHERPYIIDKGLTDIFLEVYDSIIGDVIMEHGYRVNNISIKRDYYGEAGKDKTVDDIFISDRADYGLYGIASSITYAVDERITEEYIIHRGELKSIANILLEDAVFIVNR